MKSAERVIDLGMDAGGTLALGLLEHEEPAKWAEALGYAAQRIAEAIAEGERAFVGFREGVEAAAKNAAQAGA